jgi:hypothetical protein
VRFRPGEDTAAREHPIRVRRGDNQWRELLGGCSDMRKTATHEGDTARSACATRVRRFRARRPLPRAAWPLRALVPRPCSGRRRASGQRKG